MEKLLEKYFIFDFKKRKERIREVKKELGKEGKEREGSSFSVHFT